jgi:hypothetical protein
LQSRCRPRDAPTPSGPFIDAEWPLLGGPRDFKGVLIDDERSLKRRVARPGDLDLEEVRETAMVLAQALPAHAA